MNSAPGDGNYPQFSKKLTNSLESKLNNYHSLLNTKIGSENETFDSVLRNLDTYFDCRYVEHQRAYYSDSFRGEKYQREKNALISLMLVSFFEN